jgi:hypothetical protein
MVRLDMKGFSAATMPRDGFARTAIGYYVCTMPWDLVRDGESLTIDVDELHGDEVEPLVEAVRVQVADGVADVAIVARDTSDDGVRDAVDTLAVTCEAFGADVHMLQP